MPVFLSVGEVLFLAVFCFSLFMENVSVSIVSWVCNVHFRDVVCLFVCTHVVCEFRIVHSFGWALARFISFLSFLPLFFLLKGRVIVLLAMYYVYARYTLCLFVR